MRNCIPEKKQKSEFIFLESKPIGKVANVANMFSIFSKVQKAEARELDELSFVLWN